jgi:hypothetical protein
MSNIWLVLRRARTTSAVLVPFLESASDDITSPTGFRAARHVRFSPPPTAPRTLFGVIRLPEAGPMSRSVVSASVTAVALVTSLLVTVSVHSSSATPYPSLSLDPSPFAQPASLALGPAKFGSPITNEQATHVIQAAWRLRENALVLRQPNVIRSVETGSQADLDAQYLEDLAHGQEPVIYSAPRPADAIDIFIPPPAMSTSYFAAAVSASPTHDPTATTDLLIMTRTRTDRTWKIAFVEGRQDTEDGIYFPGPLGIPGGWDGFDFVGNGYTGWLSQLAAYYATWKDTGHPPTHDAFVTGILTDEKGEELTDRGQDSLTDHGLARQTYTFVAPPQSEQWLIGYGGTAATCGNIVETRTEREVDGILVQKKNRSSWGAEVAPGSYKTIVTRIVFPVCVSTNDTASNSLQVFGNEDSNAGEYGLR